MKTNVLVTAPRTIEMNLYTVTVPDCSILKMIKAADYEKVGKEVTANASKFTHKPGERLLGIYRYESTRSIYHNNIEKPTDVASMYITHEGKVLKGRFATIEELICFEQYLGPHYHDCITAMSESIDVEGYKYDICRHRTNSEGIRLEKQWVQSKGILVAFEEF